MPSTSGSEGYSQDVLAYTGSDLGMYLLIAAFLLAAGWALLQATKTARR